MDDEFEAGLSHIVDEALAAPPTEETFKSFQQAYRRFHSEGFDRATRAVKHLLFERDLFDFPPEYSAALDDLLPRQRREFFVDITEELSWTVCDELTEEDRRDGYKSLSQFFAFLTDWRRRYREMFGR